MSEKLDDFSDSFYYRAIRTRIGDSFAMFFSSMSASIRSEARHIATVSWCATG